MRFPSDQDKFADPRMGYNVMGRGLDDIISRPNAEGIKIAAMLDIKKIMKKFGFNPMLGAPGQFAEFIKAKSDLFPKGKLGKFKIFIDKIWRMR